MGLQGDILSDAVRRSAMQRAGKRGRMARIRSDAKTPEQMEHVLRADDARSSPFAYGAVRARTQCRSISEMAEALVQRHLRITGEMRMASRRIRSFASNVGIHSREMAIYS